MDEKYLNANGLAVLWGRIQQLVEKCGGGSTIRYRLESDGSNITLVGTDGSRSSVSVVSTATCGDDEEISVDMTLEANIRTIEGDIQLYLDSTINITTSDTIENATLVLERINPNLEGVEPIPMHTWNNLTLTDSSTLTDMQTGSCLDFAGYDVLVRARLYVGDQVIAEATDTYTQTCVE